MSQDFNMAESSAFAKQQDSDAVTSQPAGRSGNRGFQMMERQDAGEGQGCGGSCVICVCTTFCAVTSPCCFCCYVKTVQEYERAVLFRLGRVHPEPKGPGLFCITPCVDDINKVDLRTVSFDIPPQEVLTKDSVTVAVDGVVYYRVRDPMMSVINVEDCQQSTKLLAQTTLRNILGMKTLAEILTDRDSIAHYMQKTLDEGTDPWGVRVERVEIKDVRLPQQLQRAMAAEAEAAREARAKVVAAEGEHKASRALKEAADVINESPSALQLRYLQTLNQISAEKNSTIIFPIPIEMMRGLMGKQD